MAKLLKYLKENFYYLGIGFLLFFIPLYPKFPLVSVLGTYVSVRLEDFFVAGIVFVFFVNLIRKKDFLLLKDSLTRLIILFFGIGLLSVLSGFFITKNITLHIAFLHFIRRVEYLSLFFVTYSSIKNFKQLKLFGWIILISSFGVIVYGLGQKFFGWPVVSTMNKEFSKGLILRLTWWARINSTFAGHYDLAAYMVMIFSLCVSAIMIVKKTIVRIVIFILALFSYYIIILTASRISFVAYLAGVLVILFFSKKWWLVVPFLALSILGMVFSDDLGQRYAATFKIDLSFMSGMVKIPSSRIAEAPEIVPTIVPVAIVTSVPVVPKPLVTILPTPTPTLTPTPTPQPVATSSGEYFEPTQLAVSRSTDIRLKVEWPRAIGAFLKNPLLGTGYSSITLATDNDYLRILGETGILGALSFALVLAEIVRKMFLFIIQKEADKKTKLLILGILGASVGYFINACFIDVWEASKIAFFFWIMIGVGLKVIDLESSKFKGQS